MGRESILAQSTSRIVERKGGKSLTHPKLEAAKIEWQVASIPSANRQEYM